MNTEGIIMKIKPRRQTITVSQTGVSVDLAHFTCVINNDVAYITRQALKFYFLIIFYIIKDNILI